MKILVGTVGTSSARQQSQISSLLPNSQWSGRASAAKYGKNQGFSRFLQNSTNFLLDLLVKMSPMKGFFVKFNARRLFPIFNSVLLQNTTESSCYCIEIMRIPPRLLRCQKICFFPQHPIIIIEFIDVLHRICYKNKGFLQNLMLRGFFEIFTRTF